MKVIYYKKLLWWRAKKRLENLLRRKFSAEKPNRLWTSDITECRLGSNKLYLSPLIDHLAKS
jgi:transposase InsO family protein